jgi:hypothetical protein
MLGRLLPNSESMVLRTLRGTEWSQLGDYVSPSFFEVLPARALWAQLRELGGNARDGRGFAVAARAVETHLASLGSPVRIGGEGDGAAPGLDALDEAGRRARGQRVLEVYFAQLVGAPATILDLRASRFEGRADDLHWRPRPLWLRWEPDFLEGLRDLYAGFYDGDDARFRAALAALGLSAAEDVFREHFGGDDQSAVRFEAATFQATFHEAFVRCRDEGTRLHRNFLALGIYLGCLYDHLEALGLAFDVRAAWQRASAPR